MLTKVTVNGRTYHVRNPLLFIHDKLDLPHSAIVYKLDNGEYVVEFSTRIDVPETLSSGSGNYRREW